MIQINLDSENVAVIVSSLKGIPAPTFSAVIMS
jgi:hypothetical protein